MADTGGLLDFLKSEGGQGLLSAAFTGMATAQKGTPWNNLGRAGVGGIAGYANAVERKDADQLKQLQMQNLTEQIAANKRNNQLIGQALGYSADGTTAPTAALPAMSATSLAYTPEHNAEITARQQAMPQAAPQSSGGFLSRMTPDTLALLKLGGKDLTDVYKLAQPNWQNVNGYMVNTNDRNFKGGFQPGFSVSQDGKASLTTIGADGLPVISAPKGAMETYKGYQDAQERAKAPFSFQKVDLPGGPQMMTTLQLSDYLNGNGGGVRTSPAPTPSPANAVTPPNWGPVNQAFQGKEGSNRQERIAVIQRELANEKDPDNQAAMQRELQRLGANVAPSAPGISLENKDRTAVTNEIAKQRLSSVEKEAQGAQSSLALLGTAKRLISQGTYGNGMLDRAGMAAHNFGFTNTPEGINTNQLNMIGNQLVLAKGSLGAGTSNEDARRYDQAAGDFGRAKSNAERLAAIQTMEEIFSRQLQEANRVRQQFSQEGSTPDYVSPAKQGGSTAKNGNKPKSKAIQLDGGGSAYATLGQDGNYYVMRGGKRYRVEE